MLWRSSSLETEKSAPKSINNSAETFFFSSSSSSALPLTKPGCCFQNLLNFQVCPENLLENGFAWKRSLARFWIDHNQSLQPKRLQMKCDVWKPCWDLPWLDELLFSIWKSFEQSGLDLLFKTIIYCITDPVSVTWSQISVLNFRFSVLAFLGLIISVAELPNENHPWSKIMEREKPQSMSYVSIKGLQSKMLEYVVWPWDLTRAIWLWQSCTQKIDE